MGRRRRVSATTVKMQQRRLQEIKTQAHDAKKAVPATERHDGEGAAGGRQRTDGKTPTSRDLQEYKNFKTYKTHKTYKTYKTHKTYKTYETYKTTSRDAAAALGRGNRGPGHCALGLFALCVEPAPHFA
jgi:hypothetical protein